jgi:hypothetical protein
MTVRILRFVSISLLSFGFTAVVPALTAGTPSLSDALRFLRQSTFGPNWELVDRLQGLGFESFLAEQFSAPKSDYPDLDLWPQTRPQDCTGA